MIPETLEIKIQKKKDYVIILPKGRIDSMSFQNFVDVCMPLAMTNNIIFNFQDLSYISSAGIGVIFKIMKQTEEKGFKIILCNVSPSVAKVIKLTRLENLFTIKADLNQAVSEITSGKEE